MSAAIHQPQVWIERADIERARPVPTDYDERTAERLAAERLAADRGTSTVTGPPIEVVCESCGNPSRVATVIQKGRKP